MTHGIQQGRRRLRKRALFGIMLLVGLAAFGVFRFYGNQQLGQRIEALRAQGFPMTLAEMDDMYRGSAPTDQDNAWLVYLSAFESLVKWENEADVNLPGYSGQRLYERGASWQPFHLETAQAFLADNKECLELLYSAVEIGPCFRPMDFTLGHNMRLDCLSEARDCAKLLRLASQVAAQQGDIDGALAPIEAIFPLAESAHGPAIVMNLVRLTMWAVGIGQMEDVLNHHALTDEQMQTLAALLEPIESTDGFGQSLIGERCISLSIFSASLREMGMFSNLNGSDGDGLWALLIIPRKILGLHDQDALSYINVTQDYIDATVLPRYEAKARIEAIEDEHQSRLGMVARTLSPSLNRIYERELRSVAQSICARTALAVERYGLDTGQLPETLNQLVPAFVPSISLDPFNGQPLGFRHLDKGYVVYSVGADLVDNQGEERKTGKDAKGQTQTAWDETFTVTR